MIYIECPWCGFRDDSEFHYGGEAHIQRPVNSPELTDEEFSKYLFMKTNTKGLLLERWSHSSGCRRWFNVLRNTVTNEILEVYLIKDMPKTTAGKETYKNNWRKTPISKNSSSGRDRK
ncbi:MAG: sarcosine oxidase subunit delta [Rhodospirillaceae bacterium]|nr:sarcosine oxidase subunit delta [Rhodospirillaceae bacterium]